MINDHDLDHLREFNVNIICEILVGHAIPCRVETWSYGGGKDYSKTIVRLRVDEDLEILSPTENLYTAEDYQAKKR